MRTFDLGSHVIEVFNTPNGLYYRAFKRDQGLLVFERDGLTTIEAIEKLVAAA